MAPPPSPHHKTRDLVRFVAAITACGLLVALRNQGLPVHSARIRAALTCTVDKLGGNLNNNMYGAWYVCGDLVRAPATLISVGSGCDSTFEQAFLTRYPGSAVHVLDPTITHARFQQCASSSAAGAGHAMQLDGLTFWRVGLSNKTRMVAFNKSPDPRIGSRSEVQLSAYIPADGDQELVVDMPTMYAMLSIEAPPLLKVDIEGSEFRVIQRFCDQPSVERALWPTQIMVEFHDRLIVAGRAEGSFGRAEAYACLQKAGYSLQYESASKEEVLFVRHH